MSITIKDIARMARVSTATVSKIVNKKDGDIGEETRERVNKIIKEHNYIPNKIARSMVTKRTKSIGLIIPDVRNPFFTDLTRGAEDAAMEKDYNIMFCNTDDSLTKEIKYINMFIEKMIDGIVLVGASQRNKKLEEEIRVQIPITIVDRDVSYPNIKSKIYIDNVKGAYDAVKYLIDLGHREIIFLTGPMDIKPSVDRLEGYKRALEEHQLNYSSDHVFIGRYHMEHGEESVEKLLGRRNFSAIFCGNDLIAAGVIKALKERDIQVPEEVSVVGFDDIYIASIVQPSITTIRQPAYEIGYLAADQLIKIIEGEGVPSETVLETEIVIRNSTKERAGV